MIRMGVFAKDKITGFQGYVTGHANYITGCDQVLLVPRVSADGEHRVGQWFDEPRLEIVEGVDPIEIPAGDKPGGDLLPEPLPAFRALEAAFLLSPASPSPEA